MSSSHPERAAVDSDVIASLRIRPMRLDDLRAVHEIDVLSFTLPWPESSFRYELQENPRSIQQVAEVQQNRIWQIVGEIVVWLIMDEAHIATIRANNIKTINAITGYIEDPFGAGQMFARAGDDVPMSGIP